MEKYPDQQLNTAFQAYMKNPNAANQVVQATAKGAPTGLQGLAAAAAAHQFQTDQEAQQQQQMMQQQAQGQPPSIVQQLAMQTSQMPGIMGQLGPSMDLAGAPSSPAPQMQQMAGGGLVAFADGGMVLPPDVLEAIQSHFAQGGEIRGFTEGENIWSKYDPLLTDETLSHAIERNKAGAREEALLSGDMSYTKSPYRQEEWNKAAAELPAASRKGDSAYDRLNAAYLESMGNPTPASYGQSYLSPSFWRGSNLKDKEAGIDLAADTVSPETPAEPKEHKREKSSDFPKPKTYNAATPPGHPQATPKQEVHQEAQNTDPAFSQVKQDMPTTVTHPGVDGGLGGLMGGNMDLGQVRDMISELRGHQTLDPEVAQQLAELKGDAQTNTIVQSLLGGLGAGLSSPYGGRFALGKAALGALSGYEQGSKGEEDIGKNAFNVLKGYKDAPALEQQKAADVLFNQMGDTAKLQSAERQAEIRGAGGLSLADRLLLKSTPSGMNPAQILFAQERLGLNQQGADRQALDSANKAVDAELSAPANATNRLNPAFVDSVRRRIYAQYGVSGSIGANTGATGAAGSGIVLRNRPQ